MRVRRARYFLAAVETGSLRAAAARCGVSQPTLGEQVSLLEEELDIVLLTRSRRGVRPTPAGQAMVAPLARLVEAEDLARRAALESGGTYKGQVAIGTVAALVENLLAPVVAQLRRDHPGLKFRVVEGSTTEIQDQVLGGDLDLGVATALAEPAPAGVRRTHLFGTPLRAVLPFEHPLATRDELTWDDLARWPIVTMRPGTALWDQLQRHVPGAEVVVHAMSARSVTLLVARGAGLGLLAHFAGQQDPPGLRMLPVRDAGGIEVDLLRRTDTRPSPGALVVQRLIEARGLELRA